MVHLVDDQQGAGAADLAQVKVGGGGDALVGGDIACQPAARIGRIVCGTNGKGMIESEAPCRIGKGFFRLQTQTVARHDPADPLDDAGLDQPGGRDHRQQRLAAAGRDGSQDVAGLRSAICDGVHDVGETLLVRAERAEGQAAVRQVVAMPRR